jgi:voltage-gated potassium channel
VSHFIELTTMDDSLDLAFEEILIGEDARFVNRTLRESGIRSDLDVIIVAIRRQGGEMLFNPSPDSDIRPGDRLIAVGKRENLVQLEKLAMTPARLRT